MKKKLLVLAVIALMMCGCGKIPKLENGEDAVVTFKDNEAISVIKNLKEFPDVIISSADKNEPSLVSRHLIEIAKSFSRFYNEHQIICEDKETQNARLALTKAVGIAIKNGLAILQ